MTSKYLVIVDNDVEGVFDIYQDAVDKVEDVALEIFNDEIDRLCGVQATWEQLEGMLETVRIKFKGYKFPEVKVFNSTIRLKRIEL